MHSCANLRQNRAIDLTPTPSADEMMRAPLGRALVADGVIYANPAPDLFYTVLHGRPSTSGVTAWIRTLPVELLDKTPLHASLIDASRLVGVDAEGFAALERYVKSRRALLASKITRLVLVRPAGMEGAVVAGFFSIVGAPYPVLVAERIEEATSFLGDAASAERVAFLRSFTAALVDRPEVVTRTAALIQARGFDVDVAAAAKALSMSTRTLQRRLGEAGTSFVEVQRGVRLATAEKKMLDTDLPLTAVAIECGYSSLQHFAAEWKAAHGTTPSEWRKARKR